MVSLLSDVAKYRTVAWKYILSKGRITWYNPVGTKAVFNEEDEEEEEEERNDEPDEPQPEVGPPLLTPLAEDESKSCFIWSSSWKEDEKAMVKNRNIGSGSWKGDEKAMVKNRNNRIPDLA